MKKLKLKMEGGSEMLTKEQMKKVVGGYDDCSSFPNTRNWYCHWKHEFMGDYEACDDLGVGTCDGAKGDCAAIAWNPADYYQVYISEYSFCLPQVEVY